MISEETILPDTHTDEALHLIKALSVLGGFTAEKRQAQSELQKILKKQGYISFLSTYRRYLVSTVGASYLYDVPLYKKGNLESFKGKRVRVVCVASGPHTERTYMAGVVGDTPPELVVERLERKYDFPAFAETLKIQYKSPRFRAVEITPKLSIITEFRGGEAVDLNGWDALLLDGKLGTAVATLRLEGESGAVEARHLSWHPSVSHRYDSIRAAIEEIAL